MTALTSYVPIALPRNLTATLTLTLRAPDYRIHRHHVGARWLTHRECRHESDEAENRDIPEEPLFVPRSLEAQRDNLRGATEHAVDTPCANPTPKQRACDIVHLSLKWPETKEFGFR